VFSNFLTRGSSCDIRENGEQKRASDGCTVTKTTDKAACVVRAVDRTTNQRTATSKCKQMHNLTWSRNATSDLGALTEALRCVTVDTLMNRHRQRQTVFITNDCDKTIVCCEADLDSAEPVDDAIARRLKECFTDCETKGIRLENVATATLAEVECLGVPCGPKKVLLDHANFVHCKLLTECDVDGFASRIPKL
jgi:hypothetical protein